MPKKPQDHKKIAAWQAAHVEHMDIRPRRELQLGRRIARAIDAGLATSRQDYIIGAVCQRLERDGIRITEDGPEDGETGED